MKSKQRVMRLTTEDGTELINPDAEQQTHALSRLGLPGNGFAILGSADQVYIQTSGSRANGYIIEYRDGDETKHFTSRRTDIPHEEMLAIFEAYRTGGAWKALVDWKKEFARSRTGAATKAGESKLYLFAVGILFTIGVLALAASVYFALETRQFLERAIETQGTVVEIVKRVSTGNGRVSYVPIVEYKDHKARTQTVLRVDGTSPPAYYVGEGVVVIYDPTDVDYPRNARLRTFGEIWGDAVWTLLMGIGFAGISGAHLWYFWPRAGGRQRKPVSRRITK